MRKITLFLAALTVSFAAMAQALHGTLNVGTSEVSPNYTSLSAAVTDINSKGIDGNLTLLITSNITEAADISLGINTGTNKLTIKPSAGVSPTITFQNTGASVSIDGHFVIGSPNSLNTNLISTNNVTIDGSNTVDGTTKDMTFVGSASSVARSVFRIFGNSDGITIKNCIITTKNTSASSNACVQLTDYINATPTNYTPDNFTALNNTLNANSGNGSLGAMISVSGTPTTIMTGIKIQNNIVISRATRAIMFNYVADGEISGNTITHDLQLSTGAAQTIAVMTGGSAAGTFNIFNNKITQVKTWNTLAGPSASNGIIAIDNQLASPKIVNIYNNFITGFTISSASVQGVKIYGIRHIGGSTSNIYNNTIVIPEMTDMTTMTGSSIAGIAFATAASPEASPTGTMNIKNNIIVSNETGMKTWGILRVGTGGTFTSDYNVFYRANTTFCFTGFYNTSDASDLQTWQTASSKDANSKSVAVNFTSATTGDLSLAVASVNDYNLAVPQISSVTKDITGALRAALTYAGAYEASDLTTVAKQFTATAPNGTAHVYIVGDFTGKSWDNTTPFELIPTGTANQFSNILPCVNGVNYKYVCETGDWDYQAAVSAGGAAESNHTYNAADVIAAWMNMKTVKLNVSFTTVVPTQLFVKGSWDAFATPIQLTKSGSTFSTTLSVLGNKIPGNTQYKYYTNDGATDNWENYANDTFRDNRWSIYPTMNDVVDRFTTMLVTGLDNVTANARIMRTASGIQVELDGQSTVELYTMNGVMIDKTVVNGTYSHDLNNGAYILRINGKATKFIK